MSYYMRPIVRTCDHNGCKRDARYRVYGHRNEPFGEFCLDHAKAKVTDLERYEQAHDYARSKGL